MSLRVLDPGLFTTVQDHGRPGYREFGVPPGGVFDRAAADLANALVGNRPGAAVLELTLKGGMFEATAPLALALAGAPMATSVHGRDGRDRWLELPLSFPVDAGDCLVIGTTPRGVRTYLAVAGGWQTPLSLRSRSSETRLKAGDVLPCASGVIPVRHTERAESSPPTEAPIRVIEGPDGGRLDSEALSPRQVYRVRPECDRVGLRLEGSSWDVPADPNRVSTPVAPGALQWAGGQPLILGVACGTMGGYPHVAHVISADLDRLAQLRPGDRVRFERVSLAEARRLDRESWDRRRNAERRIAAAALDARRFWTRTDGD